MLLDSSAFGFLFDESASSGTEMALVTLMLVAMMSWFAPMVGDRVSSVTTYVGCQISAYVEGTYSSCLGASSPATPSVPPTPVAASLPPIPISTPSPAASPKMPPTPMPYKCPPLDPRPFCN